MVVTEVASHSALRIDGVSPGIFWRNNIEFVRVEAYGKDSVRVRITNGRSLGVDDGALGAILKVPEIEEGDDTPLKSR